MRRAREFLLRVGQTNGRPLIWLNRQQYPDLPEGQVDVAVEGEWYSARFVKIRVQHDVREGSTMNMLPEILSRWFGEDAGGPGTGQFVVLRREADRWDLSARVL